MVGSWGGHGRARIAMVYGQADLDEGEVSVWASRRFSANVLALMHLDKRRDGVQDLMILVFMALRQPISKALTCHSCQRWILRSLIGSIGEKLYFPNYTASDPAAAIL